MDFRIVMAGIISILAPMSLPLADAAEAPFPSRSVRMIVPTSTGGGADFVSRLVAQRLEKRWNQTVVVDNGAGAAGQIGFEILARSAPDGYTLLSAVPGHMVAAQSGKLSFDRGGDFTMIALSATSPQLLVVTNSLPAKSLKELVELARAKPRTFAYATTGIGGTTHLSMVDFLVMAGADMTAIPYKGTGPSLADLISGRVQLAITSPPTVQSLIQAGQLRGLAVTGTKRLASLPDVPTFAEGGFPRYDMSVWYVVFGPARMPAPLVAKINTDISWAVQQPDLIASFASAGVDPAGGLSSAQVTDYIASQAVKWNNAAKAAEKSLSSN